MAGEVDLKDEKVWLAGFDPGGEDHFGWCVAEVQPEAALVVRKAGVVSGAPLAVAEALQAIPAGSELVAAGIDSPLYWSATGDRHADAVIRDRIRRLGCVTAGGTVQHVNSLRGACLVQGVLVAHLLRIKAPRVSITESHPKALLWLMGIASPQRGTSAITLDDLGDHFRCETTGRSEHERDAALAVLTAWAMVQRRHDWHNLLLKEDKDNVFHPVSNVAYWMPVMTSREDQHNPETAVTGQFDLADFFEGTGLEVIDNRPLGGALWVVGGIDLSDLMAELQVKGIKFDFKQNGGRATHRRQAWLLSQHE